MKILPWNRGKYTWGTWFQRQSKHDNFAGTLIAHLMNNASTKINIHEWDIIAYIILPCDDRGHCLLIVHELQFQRVYYASAVNTKTVVYFLPSN